MPSWEALDDHTDAYDAGRLQGYVVPGGRYDRSGKFTANGEYVWTVSVVGGDFNYRHGGTGEGLTREQARARAEEAVKS